MVKSRLLILPLVLNVMACQTGTLLAQDSLDDSQNVTGSDHPVNVDEASCRVIFYVKPADQGGSDANSGQQPEKPFATVSKAFATALQTSLAQGLGTKIELAPGTYRDGYLDIDATGADDALINAPLVLEGPQPGSVTISGSDLITADQWHPATSPGLENVYWMDWKENFGNRAGDAGPFCPKNVLAHRSEMVFLNDKPMRQVLIEKWFYHPKADGFNGQGTWTFDRYAGPSELVDGSFGVAETANAQDDQNKLFIKLPPDVDLKTAKIEVARRRSLMWILGKKNVVLRNLTFQHAASGFGDAAVMLGKWIPKTLGTENILIDHCAIQWNNGCGLAADYTNLVDVKNTQLNHNGNNGFGGLMDANETWSHVQCDDNGLRTRLDGGYWWDSAGWKSWCAVNFTIDDVSASNNFHLGWWFDGQGRNIHITNGKFDNNTDHGWMMEIGDGPLLIENSEASGNVGGFLVQDARNATIKNCTAKNNRNYGLSIGNLDNRSESIDREGPDIFQWDHHGAHVVGKVHFIGNTVQSGPANAVEVLKKDALVEASGNTYSSDKPEAFKLENEVLTFEHWQRRTEQDSDSTWNATSP